MAAEDDEVAAAVHLIGHLIDSEENILSIAKFLSAKDCLSLQAVNQGLHDIITKHGETLFEHHLQQDFAEGFVLLRLAKSRKLSFKKLYRAFHCRWSLPKQADVTLRKADQYIDVGDRNTKVNFTWSHPRDCRGARNYNKNLLIQNDDRENVIFIVRVGRGEKKSCAPMEWNKNFDKVRGCDQLVVDAKWCDDVGELFLPQDREITKGWYYQVATLMEDCQMDELHYYNRNDNDGPDLRSYYGYGLPRLFGVACQTSPFYRKLKDSDYHYNGWYDEDSDEEGPPPLEHMPISGRLLLDTFKYKDEYVVMLHKPQNGVSFNFFGEEFDRSSVQQPHQICSFLSALMKEKCPQIEPRWAFEGTVVTQQPDWAQVDRVLDTITSFASFEDQAGKLRLVSHQFGAAALRQLETKLGKTKVIGFMRDTYECGGSWFKATVHRGWSDTCLTSKESAIDDALWLASCKCSSCADKNSCKNASEPLTCHHYNSKSDKSATHTIDVAMVRQKLAEKGLARLIEKDKDDYLDYKNDYYTPSNELRCSFEELEMNLYDLSCYVAKEIDSNIDEEYMYREMGRRVPLNSNLKRDYGVSKEITSRRFLRSISLVFASSVSKTAPNEDGSTNKNKKARVAPFQKVTVGMAKSNVSVKDGNHFRMKKIIRFYSADNEQMEICLEKRSISHYYD